MQQQITHDGEVHRQHVRLKIPIGVDIDGTRYATEDWSLGGFGVTSSITTRRSGDRFAVRLMFPFEDFEIALQTDCVMVYVTDDGSRFGCRFTGLATGQLALFRYIVEAYLSGEMVSGGDVLHVAARDRHGVALGRGVTASFLADDETLGRRLGRWLGYLVLTAVALALLGGAAFLVNQRYIEIATDAAVIEAPVFRVRAPATGTIEALLKDQELIRVGGPIAQIHVQDGGNQSINSPCECVLEGWEIGQGQYAQAGDVVANLVAADQPLVIRALVSREQAGRLRVGQVAEISVPGKVDKYSGQVDHVDFKARLGLRGADASFDAARAAVAVIVRPDKPLDFEDLGSYVRVRFR